MALFNLARMTVSSTGTGTITLNAAVSGFITFDAAGCSTAATGQAVTYGIGDTTQSELGYGTYYSSGPSLTRGPVNSTNGNAAIAMSNSAQVFVTPQAHGIIGRINIQSFTANGTYTPTTGLINAIIECAGGGGGGGGTDNSGGIFTSILGGGGGGGGSYSRTVVPSSLVGTSQTVTIGAGGAGGVGLTPTNGSSGGTTSVGTLCTAPGGSGGITVTNLVAPTGGAGGSAGTGDFKVLGSPGSFGIYDISLTNQFIATAYGGNSHFGPGGIGVVICSTTNAAGTAATANTGGGGGGSGIYDTTDTNNGGAGGSGIAIITEYCSL